MLRDVDVNGTKVVIHANTEGQLRFAVAQLMGALNGCINKIEVCDEGYKHEEQVEPTNYFKRFWRSTM